MDIERFRAAWHDQEIEGEFARGEDEMIHETRRRMKKFHRKIAIRDITELLAAVLVAVIFGVMAWNGNLAMRIGAAGIVAAGAYVTYRLHRARRKTGSPTDSLRGRLEQELAGVERQIELLRGVLGWYILPLSIAGVVFGLGLAWSVPMPDRSLSPWFEIGMSIAVILIFLLVGLVIYRLNQSAVRRQLLPLRDELAAALNQLVDGANGARP